MNWLRLLEVLEMARRRIQSKGKPDRGFQWACYCGVCCELRRLAS